ncbi:MAG TPA: hypothetical protein VGQ33_16895, partial [Vicinamibacteria bacterium]|nr:hypothetical protein [Vicinamibacteria bacterium]
MRAAMKVGRLIASGIAAAAAASMLAAAPARRTENVVLITTDGLRWQEVFSGAEEALLTKDAGVADPEGLRLEFWRDTPAARREVLLPFLWQVLAKQGQLYGNADQGSVARVTNGHNFSYPGYNELLSGLADPRIDSNDKKPNPNVTVLEWLNGREPYRGRVGAFCSWDAFPWILNRERSGLVVNAGFELMTAAGEGRDMVMLNQLLADTTPAADGVRHDSFTYAAALAHVQAARPRVLYISYGETDDWAHAGRYDHYLHSAQRFDRFVRQLWDEMQGIDQYRGKTTFVITTDHGRGQGLTGWKSHGEKIPESENIWIGVLGPDTPPLGESTETKTVTQSQVAATVAAALGENFAKAMPGVAAPIAGAIRSAAGSREVKLDRARLMELFGRTPPAPPPLAPERVETVDLGDVVREKVTYAVEADERVPAFVFVPKGQGPFPAVLCHHQHGGEFQVGKDGPAGLGSTEDQHY